MLPSFSLPPLEFCLGTSPIHAEKSRPDRKALGSPTLATRAVASAGPTPGILIEPLACLIGSVPGHDEAIEVQDLGLQHPQLGTKCGETRPRNLRYAVVSGIGDDIEQFLDTIASDRRDDAELGKVSAGRIDHCSLLPNE